MAKLQAVIVVLLLALLAGGGAFYGLNRFTEAQVTEQTQARLTNAELQVLDTLRVDAFKRIEALSAHGRDEGLVAALSKLPPATAGLSDDALKAALQPTSDSLSPLTADLQKKLKIDWLGVLSAEGLLLSSAPNNDSSKSYKGLPAVQDCLAGIARDGMYEFDGKLNQVALSPIDDGRGKRLGCLMSAQLIDQDEAKRLSKLSGLQVAFFLRKKPAVSTMDAAATTSLAPLVDGQGPLSFGNPTGPVPLLIDLNNKAYMASPIALPGGTDPVHLVVVADVAGRFASLIEAQMMVLYGTGGLLLFGILLGLLLSARKVDRQVERLRDSLRLMAEGNGYSLDPDNYSGIYNDLARDLKRLSEGRSVTVAQPAGVRGPETVSQILGTSQESEPPAMPETASGSLDFESLLGNGSAAAAPAAAPQPPPEPAPVPTPAFAAPAPTAAPTPAPAPVAAPAPAADSKGPRVSMPGDLASFFDEGEGEQDSEATREVPEAASLASAPPAMVTAFPPQPAPVLAAVPPPPLGDVGFETPQDLDSGYDDYDEDDDPDYRPDATVIAQVPDELLKAAASESAEPAAPAAAAVPPPPTSLPRPPVLATGSQPPGANSDEVHFRDVFNQFVQTKKQCNEPTAGLTVDKFVEKLRKNSTDMKARYRCKSVKFQVYVKNGKAALKATPIK